MHGVYDLKIAHQKLFADKLFTLPVDVTKSVLLMKLRVPMELIDAAILVVLNSLELGIPSVWVYALPCAC